MKKLFNILVVSFALVFSSSAFANTIGVVYDSGGKFDKSFNELSYKTAQRVVDELGWSMIEFESSNDAQIEQGMRKVADRGATMIVAMGFAMADAIGAVAADYPDIKFVATDICWLDDVNNNMYWMGTDSFFIYDGRVNVLKCPLLRYVFEDINREQAKVDISLLREVQLLLGESAVGKCKCKI